MKFPICLSCAGSSVLCSLCQKKLDNGEISNLDIDISRILFIINEKHNISEASFYKSLDFGNLVVILTKGQVGFLIGRGGKVVSAISSALLKKVRVVQTGTDIKKSISDLLAPVTLLGINNSFSNGEEYIKIRLSKKDIPKLVVSESILQKVISEWLKKEVKIAFE